jgi:hypothetical protein
MVKGPVLFATLGYTPRLVMAPLRHHPEIRAVHVFYGPPGQKKAEVALAKLRTACEALDVQLWAHGVKDAFDYLGFLHAMEQAHGKLPTDTEVLFNGSGGPRPMTMAATIFCFTRNVPLLYYDEYNSQGGRVIPLKAYRSLQDMGDSQRRILQRLQRGEADMGTLSQDLGLAPSTLTKHVTRLEENDVVSVAREGKRRIVTLQPDLVGLDMGAVA